MSEPIQFHSEDEACSRALGRVHAFLHGELPEEEADLIRLHLDACEKCLDNYDVEQAINALLRRCNTPVQASSSLRMRITTMGVHVERGEQGA